MSLYMIVCMNDSERQPVKERERERRKRGKKAGARDRSGREQGLRMNERKQEQEKEIWKIWRGISANVEKPFNISTCGLLRWCAKNVYSKERLCVCVYYKLDVDSV